MITIEPLTEQAVDFVLAHLRATDREEMKASGLKYPREAFLHAMRQAPYCGAMVSGGVPIAIFGVNPLEGEPDVGLCWLVGTDGVRAERIGFARCSRRVLEGMRECFPVLRNWVFSRHAGTIRWLRWLGFEIDETPVGPGGQFYAFGQGG